MLIIHNVIVNYYCKYCQIWDNQNDEKIKNFNERFRRMWNDIVADNEHLHSRTEIKLVARDKVRCKISFYLSLLPPFWFYVLDVAIVNRNVLWFKCTIINRLPYLCQARMLWNGYWLSLAGSQSCRLSTGRMSRWDFISHQMHHKMRIKKNLKLNFC